MEQKKSIKQDLKDNQHSSADYKALYEGTKQRENSLQATVEKYEKIMNEVEDTVGEVDLNGTVTWTNKSGFKLWGYTDKEAHGVNFRTYMDKDTAAYVFQEYNKVFRTGIPRKVMYEIVRKDSSRRIIEDSVSLVKNEQGKVTGFRTISRDITQRMKTEKALAENRTRLEAIFRSVKDAIITVDPELKVIDVNNSTENICGISKKEIVGKTFTDCFHQCSQSCLAVLKQTIEKKVTVKEYRVECGYQLRVQQLISVTSSPLLDPDGNFTGAVMVIRDNTLFNELERELRERHQFQNMIGRSKRMQDIYKILENLANMETTVLITGRSGTGKELVAKAIHYSGNRAFKPFVTVNCSALAENLLESELFGHVRGAFTGAIKDRQGRFAAADGGTIFLDEIGDISPTMQLKLLRVIQEKVFERVGESIPQKVDVRVVAATNKDLRAKVKSGEFREDLFYRLKVVEVNLPDLCDRLEDLPLLANHFISTFNNKYEKEIEVISNDVLKIFMDYSWPGNIRELEHVIEHAFVLCAGQIITMEHLPVDIRILRKSETDRKSGRHMKEKDEAGNILEALNKAGWNKTKAARYLGMDRRSIYRKIAQYKLENESP